MGMVDFGLTLLADKVIKAKDEADYTLKRDKLIAKLEAMGFDVNVEDEDTPGATEEYVDSACDCD